MPSHVYYAGLSEATIKDLASEPIFFTNLWVGVQKVDSMKTAILHLVTEYEKMCKTFLLHLRMVNSS